MSQIKAGILLSYISILIVNVAGLITTPIIIKTLGVHEYGIYALVSSYIAYIALIDLGITNTINRFVAKYRAINDRTQERKFISIILRFTICINLLILVLGHILANNIDEIIGLEPNSTTNLYLVVQLLIASLVLNINTGFINGYLAAYEEFIFVKSMLIFKSVFRVALLALLFSDGGDIVLLSKLDFVLSAIFFIASVLFFKKNKKIKISLNLFDKSLRKQIISYSMWIFVFTAITQIQWQGGQILIGFRLNPSDVGIYSIGVVLGTYYGAFSSAITGVFVARTTHNVFSNYNKIFLTQYVAEIARMSSIVLMLILINFISIGQDFIILWVGEDFISAWVIALLIMVSYTLPLVQAAANQVLEARRLFSFKSKVFFLCLSCGVVLGYILISFLGIVGMAIGISSGLLIASLIMSYYYHTKLELDMIHLLKVIFPVIILAVVISAIGYISSLLLASSISWTNIITKAMILSALYIAMLYVLVLNKKEKHSLINFKRELLRNLNIK